MLYQVIRAAADYRALLIITPPGFLPEETPEAHCFAWAEWPLGSDREPRIWHAVSALEALLIYNGTSSEKWGFAPLPEDPFGEHQDVLDWIAAQKQKEAA